MKVIIRMILGLFGVTCSILILFRVEEVDNIRQIVFWKNG